MRTTIDLPADLLRQVKVRAALDGLTLKDLITRYVEQGLQHGAPPVGSGAGPAPLRRSEPPILIPARGRGLPALSNAEIQALLDAEDAARDGAARGRTD